MSLSIIIPCLNESKTIQKAIDTAYLAANKFLKKNFEVLVADNGSTDGTLEILNKQKKAKVIHVPVRGYGAALHWGIMLSTYDNVLFADADLSYDFRDIGRFVPHLGSFDLILGSRIKGKIAKGAMPHLNRYLGTPILTILIRLIYGIRSSDCNSGMRVINKKFYQNLKMRNSGMEWASELLIKTAINHGTYKEVSINFHKDARGRKPHLKRWDDGWRHFKVILLMRPFTLMLLAFLLTIISAFTLPYSIFTTLALLLIAEFLLFCYLAAKKIDASLYHVQSVATDLIDRLPLVLFGVFISITGFLMLMIIPDTHLFTKYILLFQIVLFDLWLFFIETVKTYLGNPLPDNINIRGKN